MEGDFVEVVLGFAGGGLFDVVVEFVEGGCGPGDDEGDCGLDGAAGDGDVLRCFCCGCSGGGGGRRRRRHCVGLSW